MTKNHLLAQEEKAPLDLPPISAIELLYILRHGFTLATELGHQKIKNLSNKAANYTRGNSGTSFNDRAATRDATVVTSTQSQTSDESNVESDDLDSDLHLETKLFKALCLDSFKTFTKKNISIDHVEPATRIKARIKELITWLNLPVNKDLRDQLLELESALEKPLFTFEASSGLKGSDHFSNEAFLDRLNLVENKTLAKKVLLLDTSLKTPLFIRDNPNCPIKFSQEATSEKLFNLLTQDGDMSIINTILEQQKALQDGKLAQGNSL